jgi:hypothetical protein
VKFEAIAHRWPAGAHGWLVVILLLPVFYSMILRVIIILPSGLSTR